MRKLLTLIFALTLFVFVFSACVEDNTGSDSGKLSIVSTVFPGYDFARQICGDKAEVSMLLPPGTESHSFEPSPQDIIAIQKCDLFVYIGGESDAWVGDILSSLEKPIRTLKMMDCVDAVEEELSEGMQGEKQSEGEAEYDQHVWTSPRNAVKIAEAITAAVCELDAAEEEAYKSNFDSYSETLNKLDRDFEEFFMTVKNKTVVFGDRFPLRYFADAYGLTYFAAFPGCSTETEPSAATLKFLIDKVKSEHIGTVFYIEFSNHLVADSIAEATGAKTALFHSCHNVSQEELNSGATYISLMEQNLNTLREAMG